jgi:hypothetical protein
MSMRGAILGASMLLLVAGLGWWLVNRGLTAVANLQRSAEVNRRMQRISQIALAMDAYAQDYGTYPPAVTTNADGKPLYGWRVLLLPYLGELGLYNDFKRNVAWDDPQNAQMAYRMPGVFSDGTNGSSGVSPYVLIIGGNSIYADGVKPIPRNKIVDGLEQTLLIVESEQATGSNWLEPGELDVNLVGYDPTNWASIQESDGGIVTATCDGRPHMLAQDTTSSMLQAVVTPNGGEAINDGVLD